MISWIHRVQLAFFWISITNYVVNAGQTCLSCKGIPEPTECSFVTECGSHEQCYVQKYVNEAGHVMFDLGCADHYVCDQFPQNRKVKRVSGTKNAIVCEACCNDTKICNNRNLCGSQVLPNSSGTICYACDYQTHPESCDQITLCSVDRACYIGMTRDETTMLYHYVTGCALKETKCRILEQFPDNPYCSRCCDGDLCNDRCHRNLTNDKLCLDRNPFCPLLKDKCDTVTEVRLSCPGTCSLCQEHHLSSPYKHNVTTGHTSPSTTKTSQSPLLSTTKSTTTLSPSSFLSTTRTTSFPSTTLSTISIFPLSTITTRTIAPPSTTEPTAISSSASSSSFSSSKATTTSALINQTSSLPISTSPKVHSSMTVGEQDTDNAGSTAESSIQTDHTVFANNKTTLSTEAFIPTTTSDDCVDAHNVDCMHYDLFTVCNQTSIYYGWAKSNCPFTCGICRPVGCNDALTDCDEYKDDLCTKHDFKNFVFLNCRRYCNMC